MIGFVEIALVFGLLIAILCTGHFIFSIIEYYKHGHINRRRKRTD